VIIGGRYGVPATGVAAVVLNVTVTGSDASGFITAYPTGTAAPMTSNVNYTAGQRTANAVTVRLGSGGRVTLRNSSAGSAGIEVDAFGYYVGGMAVLPGAFIPLTPSRVLDTRVGTGAPTGAVAGQAALNLVVAGQGGVPATGVSAVVLNVAVTEPAGSGFITAYAAGASVPPVTSLSFAPGQTTSTLVTARVGAGGAVSLRNNSLGSVHLVADLIGYYLDGAVTAAGMFVLVDPARIRDTRDGTGGPAGTVPAGATVPLSVAGRGGVPAAGASAAVLTLTVTEPGATGWITVFDAGPGPTFMSSVAFGPGQTVSNTVIIRLGPGGSVTIRNNSAGTLHYIADVVGYFRL
jgi:hypothetical protein